MLFSFLQLASFAQQSVLDSIAVKIQTYINKNGIKLENRWFEIASTNDSLYLDSSIDFIQSIPFDKSKLDDSVVYNMSIIHVPVVDTLIVDIFSAGRNLDEEVFVAHQLSGEFTGGFKNHSEKLFNYIRHSGGSIPDLTEFRVYFNKEAPYNAFYVESRDSSLSQLVLDYYNTIALKKYFPPIKNGRPYCSSHLFKYMVSDNRIYHEEYKEYDNLLISDLCIYSLVDWRIGDPLDGILVIDRKNDLKDILTPKFINQFDKEHHEAVRELVIGRSHLGGSIILNVGIEKK